MKPMTALLVAFGFAAGLALGISGPFAKAGSGIALIMGETAPMAARADRITAAAEIARDGLQAVDLRWKVRAVGGPAAICAPKDEPGNASLPDIQHL
jgi:hypothetical protein